MRRTERPVNRCECGDHDWKVLTKGFVTLVSPEDAPTLERYGWFSIPTRSSGKHVYAQARVNITPTLLHRVLLDPPTGMVCDHRNGNTLDNRRPNLRVCTREQNQYNKRPIRNGPRGVYRDKKCWVAEIKKDGKRRKLGYFKTEDEAAEAYRRAALEAFGEFAYEAR